MHATSLLSLDAQTHPTIIVPPVVVNDWAPTHCHQVEDSSPKAPTAVVEGEQDRVPDSPSILQEGTYGAIHTCLINGKRFIKKVFDETSESAKNSMAKEIKVYKHLMERCRHTHGAPEEDFVYVLSMHSHGSNYITLPRCHEDLIDYMSRRQRRSIDENLRILRQVARAVAFLHQHGVAHCDIKPENFMMTDPSCQRLVILDFGLSCICHEPAATHREALEFKGTLPYIAPERLTTHPSCVRAVEKSSPFKADVFSVGVLASCVLMNNHVAFPSTGTDGEKAHDFMRRCYLLPPDGEVPNPPCVPRLVLPDITCFPLYCFLVRPLVYLDPSKRCDMDELVKRIDKVHGALESYLTAPPIDAKVCQFMQCKLLPYFDVHENGNVFVDSDGNALRGMLSDIFSLAYQMKGTKRESSPNAAADCPDQKRRH